MPRIMTRPTARQLCRQVEPVAQGPAPPGELVTHVLNVLETAIVPGLRLEDKDAPHGQAIEHAFTLLHIHQFRVVVQSISRLMWHCLLMRRAMSLATLHAAPQIVFAWSDVYLHHFHIYGKEYGGERVGGRHFEDARVTRRLASYACTAGGTSPRRTVSSDVIRR